MGNRELAREAAQDAFERLYSKYQPEQMRYPRSALFKTGERCALMQLRRRRLEHRRLGRPVAMNEDEVTEVPGSGAGPDRKAMLDQLAPHIAAVIIELRPTLRSVFVMAHVQ
ncbi:ECF subfamily RNA polymerase sigma-24 factor, partial [mine drainage metagenome]